MRTTVYDSDGRQVFSQSISDDQLKVAIDNLEKITVSIKGSCAGTGNFTVHQLALLPLIEEVCHQLASYNTKRPSFSSNLFQAEFRRLASTYSKEDVVTGEELFKEQTILTPQDRTSEKIYKIIDNYSRLRNDIRCMTQIKSLISTLQDVVDNKKINQEIELQQLVQSNPEFFTAANEFTIEEKWARFFRSILGVEKSSSDIDLDELLRLFSESLQSNTDLSRFDDDSETGPNL